MIKANSIPKQTRNFDINVCISLQNWSFQFFFVSWFLPLKYFKIKPMGYQISLNLKIHTLMSKFHVSFEFELPLLVLFFSNFSSLCVLLLLQLLSMDE